LGGANGWIENGTDVADVSCDRAVWKGVEFDLRFLAELQPGNVVLVNIADNPTVDRSAMVKAVAEPERFTPAAAAWVTFCATMTPEIGAYTLTTLLGWLLSTSSVFNCSSAAVRSAFASFSESSACSSMAWEKAPCLNRSSAR